MIPVNERNKLSWCDNTQNNICVFKHIYFALYINIICMESKSSDWHRRPRSVTFHPPPPRIRYEWPREMNENGPRKTCSREKEISYYIHIYMNAWVFRKHLALLLSTLGTRTCAVMSCLRTILVASCDAFFLLLLLFLASVYWNGAVLLSLNFTRIKIKSTEYIIQIFVQKKYDNIASSHLRYK